MDLFCEKKISYARRDWKTAVSDRQNALPGKKPLLNPDGVYSRLPGQWAAGAALVGYWSCRMFLSLRRHPLSRQQFFYILREAGRLAELTIAPHPHMLRHACGYALADKGIDTRLIQDYLGHRNIQHTVRYTASNAGRFHGIWRKKRRV